MGLHRSGHLTCTEENRGNRSPYSPPKITQYERTNTRNTN